MPARTSAGAADKCPRPLFIVGGMTVGVGLAAVLAAMMRALGWVAPGLLNDLLLAGLPALTAGILAAAWCTRIERVQRRAALDLQRRMQELAGLQRAGRFITSPLELEHALGGIVSAARLIVGCRCAAVLLHDPSSGELVYTAVECGQAGEETAPGDGRLPAAGERIAQDEGAPGWVFQHGQTLVLREPADDSAFAVERCRRLCSLAAVPLRYKEAALGVLQVEDPRPAAFSDHHLAILSTLADFAAAAVMNERLVEAEREQRQLVERSQAQLLHSEKLNAAGRLASFLAHEINNPLQALRGGFNLLLNVPLSEEKRREYLEMSSRQVERLAGVVERVLSVNRRASEPAGKVDLHCVLEEAVRLVESRLESAGIRTVRAYAPGVPAVEGSFDQLHQVCLNLILNAVAAMPRGGQLTLSTAWDAPSGLARFSVSDSGPGIPAEVLPHIFEPFYTTRPGGSGLGLAISRDIVEKHGGRIEVETCSGGGATFTVVLAGQSDK